MTHTDPTPEAERLTAARDAVQTFLRRKKTFTTALFVAAAIFEITLFVALLLVMDFHDRLYWFLFLGFCAVYSPLITFVWRNAVMIDRLYYRLIADLKYGD